MSLTQGQVSTANTATTILTVGSGEVVEVFQIELHSVYGANQTVQVFFVPNNSGAVGTAGLTNEKESFTLSTGGSLTLVAPKAPWRFSSQNDTIQIKTTVATGLNWFVTKAVNGVF